MCCPHFQVQGWIQSLEVLPRSSDFSVFREMAWILLVINWRVASMIDPGTAPAYA